ncbi:MAG: 16S rRNA processing protein RimM [Alphaproteobacteria bacterium]|jgi:16S rRNA processing protein RimM|nr:16S rRNA processing protein RimM [Alphaproteobacteria bacterium]
MKKRLCIGKIVAAHGIRGEVKVLSQTAEPTDLDKFGVVENKDGTRQFQLKVLGMSSSNVRVKIKGVDDRNTAESLIGTEFYVAREQMPKLAEDEFYKGDIVGLKVCLQTPQKVIGTVAGFANFGAGEIIELKLNGKRETEMLPFTKAYVPEINLEEGYIIVSSATMIFAADDEEGVHV